MTRNNGRNGSRSRYYNNSKNKGNSGNKGKDSGYGNRSNGNQSNNSRSNNNRVNNNGSTVRYIEDDYYDLLPMLTPDEARKIVENKRKQRTKNQFWLWLIVFSAGGIAVIAMSFIVMIITLPGPVPVSPAEPVLLVVPISTPTPRPTPSPTPTPEPTPDPMLGKVHSPLTGLPIPEEYDPLRPVAVVVNNHSRALPQKGLAQAEIIYEALAEGSITRLVAIFHQFDAEQIGPVRSTRDYFADFAIDNDAVMVHHGGSPTGYGRLRNLGIANLDGMALEGTTFWRDQERWRVPAMREHSSFTGAQLIEEAFERRNIRRWRYEDDGIGFIFNQEGIPFELLARASGGDFNECFELIIPFSTGYPRHFVFDPEMGLYAVYNVHGPHIDGLCGSQLQVTNILVQHVRSRVVDGEGRREKTTVGNGTGLLATEGGIVTVFWQRDSHSSPTRWYFENGLPMQLNPGQTWINVLQDSANVQIIGAPAPEELEIDVEENGDEYGNQIH